MAVPDKLSIINEARVEAGEEIVADLTPIDAMMRAALSRYDSIVLKEIETGEWNFAKARVSVPLNATDTSRALPYQYLIPDTSLGLIGVRFGDCPLEGVQFQIEGNAIWTIYADNIFLVYKFRPDESLWPRRFSDIIIRELTAIFMRGTERHGEAQGVRSEARIDRIVARHAEARQRHNRPMGEGSIINRRRGGAGQLNYTSAASSSSGGGGSGSDGTGDADVLFGPDPANSTVNVGPGIGYVKVDCSYGDRICVFNASDSSLRKEVFIKKTTEANILYVNDGTTNVYPEPTQQRVTWRRAFGTLEEMARSA